MPRRRTRIPLNVFQNGRLVGRLSKETTGAIQFQYDESWLQNENATPISLSLPLREDRYVGDHVRAVFDNLLPDNDAIRRRLAERVHAEGYDTYSLLAAVGRDCIGALQILPEGKEPGPTGKIDGEAISDKKIAGILNNLNKAPLGVTESEEFRISIAGAQDKTTLLLMNNRWYLPHGSTPTTHILKPQIGKLKNGMDLSHSVENEHFCMSLVAALGLPVAKTEIREFEGNRTLIVERFDRCWTGEKKLLRKPQEDCCQALSIPPTRKYESDGGPGIRKMLEFLKASDNPDNDRRLFMRSQVIFWLLGATDGHAKNFSVFLGPQGRFSMTPLYDIMSAQPNLDAREIERNQMKLAMCVGESRHYVIHTILPRHFIQTAKLAGLDKKEVPGIFRALLDKMPGIIESASSKLSRDVPEKIMNSVTGGIKSRLRQIEVFFHETGD